MNLDPTLIAELVALGIAAGFLAGLLGVGGGMMMVPFLTFIFSQRGVATDLSVKMAIATSMATIVFTSLSSVRAHHKRGAVRWDLVRGIAPGILLGGLLSGAGIFALLKGSVLAIVFALFIGYSATQMIIKRPAGSHWQMPGFFGQSAVGVGIGTVSGLVGAGGGFLSVPFMTRCNVAIHNAVATSAALGFPIALANTAGYLVSGRSVHSGMPGAVGYLVLPALALIAGTSVFVAPLGARVAHGLDTAQLKRVFAMLLYALAAYMLWRGLTA